MLMLLLVVVSLVVRIEGQVTGDQNVWSQLDEADTQLNTLATDLQMLASTFDNRFEQTQQRDADAKIHSFRLDRIFGNGCPNNYMRCGTSVQCVFVLLACDGSNDCQNGYDEDTTFCSIPHLNVGDIWIGKYQDNFHCMATLPPNPTVTYTVKSITRLPWFPSILKFEVWINTYERFIDSEVWIKIISEGVHSFGLKRVLTFILDGNVLIQECVYAGRNTHRSGIYRAQMYRYGTKAPPCATSYWYPGN